MESLNVSDPRFVDAERRLHHAISDLEPAHVSLLQELVRIPSPIGQEGQVQRTVARRMRDAGLKVDEFDIDPQALANVPGFNASPRTYRDRPCVVGVLEGSAGGPSLILNAHADTAPVESIAAWTHDPYGGVIEDGKLFGRGAWDDKAGITETILVVEALQKAGVKLKGNLIVKIVVEDETSGNGTLACLARGHTGDAAIIVDGTWPERFIVSHLGQLWFRVRLRGRTGHAATPGRNPVDAIGPVVTALRWYSTRQERRARQAMGRCGSTGVHQLRSCRGWGVAWSDPDVLHDRLQSRFPPARNDRRRAGRVAGRDRRTEPRRELAAGWSGRGRVRRALDAATSR